MRRSILIPALLIATLSASCAPGGDVPGPDTRRFGAATRAGSGGKIIRVTNVNADGPGSLAAAIAEKGPRIVVFEVGGVIDLNGRTLGVTEPFLTIAGQTAPSPGITIIKGGINIGAHDVLIKHIRVRPGDAGKPKNSGWEPDGITTSGGDAYNVVIDHCSLTWAVDENLSASGPRPDPRQTSHCITFSNNLIAEALSRSTHAKGEHSKGTLIHDNCRDIAIVGNIYTHNVDRNPRFKAGVTGVVVNNLIYNPGRVVMHFAIAASEWEGLPKPPNTRAAVVGNVLIAGPSTRVSALVSGDSSSVHIHDNVIRPANAADLTRGTITRLTKPPVWPEGLKAVPAESVFPKILSTAGARPADRDPIDARIIDDIRAGRGKIIDSQEEVGGYPKYPTTERRLSIPKTGVDAWLERLAREVETVKAGK